MPSADLFLSVAAFGTDPLLLRVDVQNDVTDPDGLRIDASIDGTAGAMAIPTTLARQRVSMRVYVDGVLVPELTACKVNLARNNNLQTWELTVPIHAGATGYAGDWRGNGTGLCKRRIDVYGVYLTSTGYHQVPLIYNGIADNEARESQGGALVTYTGVDAGGRYDREVTDFVLPPGSGLTRDRVVAIAARRCGVTEISLEESDVQMMHEFQMADASFIGPCQELADVEGRMIQWDRSGDMVWPQYGSGDLVPSSSRWSFTEKNFVRGSARLAQPGELITEVTVEGDIQEIQQACGYTTTQLIITTRSNAARKAPRFLQQSGSVYTANFQPSSTVLSTVRYERFETTRWCDTVVKERRVVRQWYNPEVARYTWNATTDTWDTIDGVYTDSDADDDSPAYQFSVESWMETEDDTTYHYWMVPGLEGGLAVPNLIPAWLDIGWGLGEVKGWDGLINGQGWYTVYDPVKFHGLKIGTKYKSKRWYAVRQYLKTRTLTIPLDLWEEIEPPDGREVLGSKESVTMGGEQYRVTEEGMTILGTDGRGYQTDEDVYSIGYSAIDGQSYLYGDQSERGESEESRKYLGCTYNEFISTGEQSHDEVVTITNGYGITTKSVQTTGLDSNLPAAERIPDSGPPMDSDIYADEIELADLYRKAYRTKSKPVSVTVTDLDLENCSTRGVHKASVSYLENEDEADWMARWLMDEARAGVFEADLAGANFFISPGDWCASVRFLALGLNPTPGRVEEVSWDWRAGSALNTSVKFLLYP